MNYWKVLLVCLAGAGLAVASCSHPSGTGTSGSGGSNGTGGSENCTSGSVGCSCNGTTCDQGLSCADVGGGQTQCVTTAGSGGTPGTGGATATGGTPGTGGNGVGTGGSSATGGGSGTGGTPGTGGNGPGTGGTTATGGNSGTGGNPANNLIANGDFSQADTNWHFESGTASVNNGQYCETNLSGSSPLFGWQNMSTPLLLSNGQSYMLSYRASGSNSAVLHIKVAHAVSPYTPDDYETNPDDQLTGSLQTFTHTFTLTMGDDDNTGVAFFVMAGQNICIASVSLVAN